MIVVLIFLFFSFFLFFFILHSSLLANESMMNRNSSVIHPPFHKNIYGKMHAKLMLLFYNDSLRVVISSANLVAYDYNLIQNIVFLQDFPLRPSSANTPVAQQSPFLDEIKRMLTAMTVPAATLCELDLYDYTKAKVCTMHAQTSNLSLTEWLDWPRHALFLPFLAIMIAIEATH